MTDPTYEKALVEKGQKRIEWAEHDMPVLRQVREQFGTEMPLKGKVLAAVLHVTCETANLVRTLKAGGAEVYLAASNPLSTQDDVVAITTSADKIAKRGDRIDQLDFSQGGAAPAQRDLLGGARTAAE